MNCKKEDVVTLKPQQVATLRADLAAAVAATKWAEDKYAALDAETRAWRDQWAQERDVAVARAEAAERERDALKAERSAVIHALGVSEDIDVGRDLVDAVNASERYARETCDMMLRAEADRDAWKARAEAAEGRGVLREAARRDEREACANAASNAWTVNGAVDAIRARGNPAPAKAEADAPKLSDAEWAALEACANGDPHCGFNEIVGNAERVIRRSLLSAGLTSETKMSGALNCYAVTAAGTAALAARRAKSSPFVAPAPDAADEARVDALMAEATDEGFAARVTAARGAFRARLEAPEKPAITVAEQIEAARRDEREACARIVETLETPAHSRTRDIAAAIRARGNAATAKAEAAAEAKPVDKNGRAVSVGDYIFVSGEWDRIDAIENGSDARHGGIFHHHIPDWQTCAALPDKPEPAAGLYALSEVGYVLTRRGCDLLDALAKRSYQP